jgi:hypothetical protein
MSEAHPDPSIRAIQRKNGKIIIRAMAEIKKVTFEAIVEKICKDYNVSYVLVWLASASFSRL